MVVPPSPDLGTAPLEHLAEAEAHGRGGGSGGGGGMAAAGGSHPGQLAAVAADQQRAEQPGSTVPDSEATVSLVHQGGGPATLACR